MISGQLKYIFSIPLLSKTFRVDFSASPFSSVSFSDSSSTHWRVSFYHSPSRSCHLQYIPPSHADYNFIWPFQKGVKSHIPYNIFITGCWEILFIIVRLKLLFFSQLYFSMSSSPNWDNSHLFWKPTYTDKLLIDGHGCSVFFICSKKVSAF